MPAKVVSVIMCDDIRKEISGKDILIGVYSGGLNVPMYPAMMQAAFWIEIDTPELGPTNGHLQIRTPSGNPPLEADFGMDVVERGTSVLAIGGLPLPLEYDGDIVISISIGGSDLTEVKRKAVVRKAPA